MVHEQHHNLLILLQLKSTFSSSDQEGQNPDPRFENKAHWLWISDLLTQWDQRTSHIPWPGGGGCEHWWCRLWGFLPAPCLVPSTAAVWRAVITPMWVRGAGHITDSEKTEGLKGCYSPALGPVADSGGWQWGRQSCDQKRPVTCPLPLATSCGSYQHSLVKLPPKPTSHSMKRKRSGRRQKVARSQNRRHCRQERRPMTGPFPGAAQWAGQRRVGIVRQT